MYEKGLPFHILIGGKGDDYLEGGDGAGYQVGNKTYQFSKGDGNDTINNFDSYNYLNTNVDIIKFTDVKSSEVSYRGENYDLIIEYGSSDSIRIKDFFKGVNYWINEFHFTDKVLTLNDLKNINISIDVSISTYSAAWDGGALTLISKEQNSNIYGTSGNDTVYAGVGNDNISGGNGNDVLYGGAGDDTLRGGNDDDILYGGEGNVEWQPFFIHNFYSRLFTN